MWGAPFTDQRQHAPVRWWGARGLVGAPHTSGSPRPPPAQEAHTATPQRTWPPRPPPGRRGPATSPLLPQGPAPPRSGWPGHAGTTAASGGAAQAGEQRRLAVEGGHAPGSPTCPTSRRRNRPVIKPAPPCGPGPRVLVGRLLRRISRGTPSWGSPLRVRLTLRRGRLRGWGTPAPSTEAEACAPWTEPRAGGQVLPSGRTPAVGLGPRSPGRPPDRCSPPPMAWGQWLESDGAGRAWPG